jgi:hypothetical protein
MSLTLVKPVVLRPLFRGLCFRGRIRQGSLGSLPYGPWHL